MVKQSPPQRRELTLDLCPRCGGIWFDSGELDRLRAGTRFILLDPSLTGIRTARCHGCSAALDRNAERCPACGAPNHLDCPQCDRELKRVEHQQATVDVCAKCRGVWFDRHEIASVWTLALATALQGRLAAGGDALSGSPDVASVVDALSYSPDVGGLIIEGSVRSATAVLDGLASAPEAAGLVAEAAGSVFEVLLSIIGAILEGLSF
jgi:Zn-finger nucleic acid-binding protein